MGFRIDDQSTEKQFGRIGTTLLILTLIAALVLLYFAARFAKDMIELAHDVPSPWTLSDFSLVALPVSIFAIALSAIFALARGKLEPLWLSLTIFLAVVVVVAN